AHAQNEQPPASPALHKFLVVAESFKPGRGQGRQRDFPRAPLAGPAESKLSALPVERDIQPLEQWRGIGIEWDGEVMDGAIGGREFLRFDFEFHVWPGGSFWRGLRFISRPVGSGAELVIHCIVVESGLREFLCELLS